MDVGMGIGGLFPVAHHLLGQCRGQIQIHHPVRLGQAQQPVLKVEQPGKKCPALFPGQLGGLVHGVGSGVAVRNDQSPALVERAPILPVAGKTIHRKESSGGIGIHIVRMRSECAGEV